MKKVSSELIVVDWLDAGGDNTKGWQEIGDFDAEGTQYKIRSVGFMLSVTKKYIHLFSDYDEKSNQFNSVNSIPRGCVTRIRRIKLK